MASPGQPEGIHSYANDREPHRTPPPLARYPGDGSTDGPLLTDWRDSPGERGTLLYRNVFTLRCAFDGAEEVAQEGVVTLYLKGMSVNIEVSLYREQSKMSIASSVHA